MSRRWPLALLLVPLLGILLLCPQAGAQGAKRLILKDGSYQLVGQWEIRGDRVRFFSSERSEWEELPSSLVDWQATENYQKERAQQRELDLRQAQQEEESDAELDAAPTVAPGLQLPAPGGVYLLDGDQGRPQLAELAQESGNLNRRTGRNILRAAINPVSSAKESIELQGEHAQVQSHSVRPQIYLNLDDPGLDAHALPLAERFRIARLETKKDSRVIGTMKIGITGRVSQQQSFVPATVEKLPAGWIKLAPAQALAPGEYAVVEMLGPKDVNMYVWDFGINPAALKNPGVWRAAPLSGPPASTQAPAGRQK